MEITMILICLLALRSFLQQVIRVVNNRNASGKWDVSCIVVGLCFAALSVMAALEMSVVWWGQ